MKSLFKDNIKSYLLVVALGVLAGLAVVLFCELPDNNLWAFYYWSANTFGFWMFSTSLIVLFSEKRKCAAISAGIYIFLMFFITTMYMSFCSFWDGKTQFNTLLEVLLSHTYGWLLYSIPPALVCAALGLILWSGRRNTFWGRTLQIMPAVFILIETVVLFYNVFTNQTRLFSALSNSVCLAAYIVIYFSVIKKSIVGDYGC